MPNYRQAPKLYHDKTKMVSGLKNKNYYNLPQELMDCVFNQLDGKCGNQIKLMTVLLGTLGDGSFGVSEAWICERTGMIQQTYSTARQALIKRGWIFVEDGNIYVLPMIIRYGIPYTNDDNTDEKKKDKFDATISKCVNDLKKQYGIEPKGQCDIVKKGQYEIVEQTQCDIGYNKINKNKEDINNKGIGLSSLRADNPILDDSEIREVSRYDIDRVIGEKEWINDHLVRLPNGKIFRVKD